MSKVVIFNHPLINHKLSRMREKETNTKDFREALNEISALMAYEVTRDLPVRETKIHTPIAEAVGYELSSELVIVPILRAGLGMVDGIHNLLPTAKIGHIGLFRNEETLKPELYYAKFPPTIQDGIVFLVDPMLATGGSAVEAINILKTKGAKKIVYIGLVGVDVGIENIQKHHPDVDIYLAAKDEKLNEKGYIVPGLGDCGDRIFGTK
ncbi:MAG: uracil phosphoribosyltransferase [Bacilli bacterium]|nr:uracil phosphoribosyltransferase [Mollicutes bacterium]MDY3898824.1 uracil phosphoribosyltransferase [Bacilli bacterium]